MPHFSDFVVITGGNDMPKKSRPGRPKIQRLIVPLVRCGYPYTITLDAVQVAALLPVSVKTAYKWINGAPMSPAHYQLLTIQAAGVIPHPGWDDWHFCPVTHQLVGANGYSFAPGELSYWSLQKALLREVQAENGRLRIQVAELRALVDQQRTAPGRRDNVVRLSHSAKKRPDRSGQGSA